MGAGGSSQWDGAHPDLDVRPWAHEAAELRWAVDIDRWAPNPAEWEVVLGALPEADRRAVDGLERPIERRRALASKLLQRRCVSVALNVADAGVRIARTRGGKPYVAPCVDGTACDRSNFNFNASHDGHLVVLASDPALLVGIDVVAPPRLRAELHSFDAVRRAFATCLTEREWRAVESEATEGGKLRAFRVHWALKEAYVKARGDGLAFELRRVELYPCRPPDAAMAGEEVEASAVNVSSEEVGAEVAAEVAWVCVHVDGELQRAWVGHVYDLPGGHVACVVRGPVSEARDDIGEFRATLGAAVPIAEHCARLACAPPPFRMVQVRELVPPQSLEAYDAACAVGEAACAPLTQPPRPEPERQLRAASGAWMHPLISQVPPRGEGSRHVSGGELTVHPNNFARPQHDFDNECVVT